MPARSIGSCAARFFARRPCSEPDRTAGPGTRLSWGWQPDARSLQVAFRTVPAMGKQHVIGAVLAFVIGAGVPAQAQAAARFHWGPVQSSAGHSGYAKADVWITGFSTETFAVSGKLYDRDKHRGHCAYVRARFHYTGGGTGWSRPARPARPRSPSGSPRTGRSTGWTSRSASTTQASAGPSSATSTSSSLRSSRTGPDEQVADRRGEMRTLPATLTSEKPSKQNSRAGAVRAGMAAPKAAAVPSRAFQRVAAAVFRLILAVFVRRIGRD